MTGGLIQLAAYGSQDHYLTGNPNISFFKCVYKQYTNFSMESIRLNFEGNTYVSTGENSTIICKLNRNADLVTNCYFCFTLPAIYVPNSDKRKFKWIKNIGTNIIERVTIYIGGALIDTHTGEWLNILRELNMSDTEKQNHDNLIGNIPDLYNPVYSDGSYKYSEPNFGLEDSSYKIEDCPTIPETLITVPLCFWFNNNSGMALPLIALQYQEVEIHIELRQLIDLYLITDENSDRYYKPEDIHSTEGIQNFLKDTDMISKTSNNVVILNYFDLNAYFDVNYIFLDNLEREKFANITHEYLVTQTFKMNNPGHNNYVNIDLLMQHPVKELVWIGKRNDIDLRNDWNNYTNWIYEDIPPYSKEYKTTYDYKNNFFPFIKEDKYFIEKQRDSIKYEYLQKNIVKTTDLLLNGLFRFRDKSYKYFNQLQNYQHYKKNIKSGIQVYSFALNPNKYQPSGSCNMSRINKISMLIDVNSIPIDYNKKLGGVSFYSYDFSIYSINYNILRITGGMGNLQFSN